MEVCFAAGGATYCASVSDLVALIQVVIWIVMIWQISQIKHVS